MQHPDMPGRRPRLPGWLVATCWTIAGFGVAVFMWLLTRGEGPLLFPVVIAVTGLLVGMTSGAVLNLMLRRAPNLAVAAVLGHLVFAPPSAQIGILAGNVAAQYLAATGAGQLPVIALNGVTAITVANVVLAIGAATGMALGAALRVALAPVWWWLGPRLGALVPTGSRLAFYGVLLVVLAYGAYYADNHGMLPWPEAESPEVSPWIEREKALFRSVLASRRYDALVLPVQDDGRSFDRAARSLMTRYLARHLEERTGSALPDPTLLARALDARARRIDMAEAQRLAESVGARTLIVTEVRRTGEAFDVAGRVRTREGDKGSWREGASGSLKGIRFHNRLPPSLAFRGEADNLLNQLKLGAAKPAQAAPPPPGAGSLSINDLLKLASAGGASPVERALHLQLMASLHERESLEAETLWERSLVALWGAPPSALDRVLEARAYLHLSRRPYALEKLGEPGTPAEQALRAVLDGDVPGVEASVGLIENRALRLMTEIELADLYEEYNFRPRLIERRKQLLEPPWTEKIALDYRLSAPEWFRTDMHGQIASRLHQLLPGGVDYLELAAAWLRWLYWMPDLLTGHDLRLARSVEERYPEVWRARGADWSQRPAAGQLAEWDYYDLLFALNRATAVKSMRSMIWYQDLPQPAAALIEALGDTFEGNPWMTYYHATALDKTGRKLAPGGLQKRLYSRCSALGLAAYRWEQGETLISVRAERYIYERKYEKYVDEPIRWYRAKVAPAREFVDQVAFAPEEIKRSAADARRRLEYSDRDAGPLRDLAKWLRRGGDVEAAETAVEGNKHRFVGTAGRAQLLAEVREGSGRGELPISIYRELIELDPNSQDGYWRLARAYLEGGKPEEAEGVFLSYPGFKDPKGHNPVGLANFAFLAGRYLYDAGEPARAVALLSRSAKFGTGAESEMRSREILALMDSNVQAAMEEARTSIERYDTSGSAARYVVYLSLLGRHEQADSYFLKFADRFNDEQMWFAAYISHRMRGIEGPELLSWLGQLASADRHGSYTVAALRERHAFLIALIDRPPTAEALEQIRRAAAANNKSPYYPQVAQGYIALRQRDFATAAQKLSRPHRDLYNISATRNEHLSELLPYLALAYARSGNVSEAEKIVKEHLVNIGTDSDYLIARALLDGTAGNHDSARVLLRRAFYRLPPLQTRTFFPGYILLEACEMLLEGSGNEAYREMIEDFARRLQTSLPYAWAAAFEAKYARDNDVRQLAVAAASILDAKSERIKHIPDAERSAVRGAAMRHGSALGAALRVKAKQGG